MHEPNDQPDCDKTDKQEALYLYCFTRPGKVVSGAELGVPGVDGRNCLALISVDGVAALHSPVLLEEFSGPDAEDSLKDPNWVVPRACRHEHAIEAMMAKSPVFPVRFGALFSSRQVLEQMMGTHQEEISRFLDRIAGKEEWSLKGYLNPGQCGDWLTNADAGLAQQHRLLPAAPGARYLQNKRFQAVLQKQVREWCMSAMDQVHEKLQNLGSDVIQLPPRAPDCMEREMVYHAAMLFNKEGVANLLDLAKQLNSEFAEKGIVFESSGPWPPYHFCPSLSDPG